MKVNSLFLFVLLSCSLAHGALNKTYPTSATTNLRIETYVDAIGTVADSTYTIPVSTWAILGSTYTYVYSNQIVSGVEWYLKGSTSAINPMRGIKVGSSNSLVGGYVWSLSNSTYTVKSTTWTIKEYTDLVIEAAKYKFIEEILDEDIEQYMVWQDTSTYPKGSWKGWCLTYVNKKPVPVVCP